MRAMTKMAGAALALMALQTAPALAQATGAERAARVAEIARMRAEQTTQRTEYVTRRTEIELAHAQASLAHLSHLSDLAGMASLARMARLADLAGPGQQAPAALAPEPWIQEDPAARAYAAAREALNNRRYEAAASAFAKLREDHPRSGYVPDSYYWQAFALYRQGGGSNYRAALELLERQGREHARASTRPDAEELSVRLEAQLARRGDARAAESITRQASQACSGQEQEVRAAALSALLNMNAEQAMPILEQVLQKRDECSAELRRQAVFLISQKMTDRSVDILLDLAHRNPDPDPEVREQAVFWLSQVKSDEALAALQSILRESEDPEVQEKAIFAISQHGSDAAVQALRQYAERADAPAELRENAIFWIGQNPRAGGSRYLMELYAKLGDPELKERTIFAIAQDRRPESRQWLLGRARDTSESVEVRKNALFWAGQTGGLTAAELRELYGTLTDPDMKEQVIFVASQRREREAVDFLMEVARTERDKELRERAIFWLGQSKDPRVAEFLLSLIG